MGTLNRLDFEPSVASEIFWQDHVQSLSYEAIRDAALAQDAFDSLPEGSICALTGFSPLESWILMLAAWNADLSILPFAQKATEESIDLALEQLPWTVKLTRSTDDWAVNGKSPIPSTKVFNPDSPPAPDISSDVYIMTSGSTGVPKAIAHNLASLTASAQATLAFYKWKRGDSWLLSLDPSHIGGLQILLRVWLGRGLCFFGGEPKDIERALQLRSCDFLSLVPTQLFRLLEDEANREVLTRAKAIILGGAAAQDSLLLKLRSLSSPIPVSVSYGSSETASQISAWPPGQLPERQDHVGKILDIWTITSDDQHNLSIKGPALMKGFWLEKVWYPCAERLELSDRGRVKERSLWLDGRRDQVFQVGGENLAPGEILRLVEHIHALSDMQVLAQPDQDLGMRPLLLIRSRSRPDVNSLLQAFTGLSPIKRPREIWWFDSDEVGKLSKAFLEQALANGDDSMHRLWIYEKL